MQCWTAKQKHTKKSKCIHRKSNIYIHSLSNPINKRDKSCGIPSSSEGGEDENEEQVGAFLFFSIRVLTVNKLSSHILYCYFFGLWAYSHQRFVFIMGFLDFGLFVGPQVYFTAFLQLGSFSEKINFAGQPILTPSIYICLFLEKIINQTSNTISEFMYDWGLITFTEAKQKWLNHTIWLNVRQKWLNNNLA